MSDPDSVPAAIATVLGITPQGDTPLVETVAETLAGRQLLLVVDNCEHVLAAAAVDDHDDPRPVGPGADRRHVARGARRRRRVARSRSRPSRATVAWPPTRSRCSSTGRGPCGPTSGSTIRQTADAVTEICETVDGLPLGIELAAARMAAMSAVEVRDRLADRFRLLQGAAPGPERQLTLRHAVEWSYDLLTDDERALLRTTAVFAGGFDLAGLGAVVDDADDVDVLRHLDSLVRKSLVVADHTAPRTRYTLFETIRQFAEDRLAEHGGLEDARDRHAALLRARGGRRAGRTGRGPGGAPRSTGWRPSSATSAPRTGGARRAATSRSRPTSPPTRR